MTYSGQVITFYSYKGGTGRSMALANVAWILASNGKRVLAIDWDLEAPGLHRYFHPFLFDKNLIASEGVIDFVIKFTDATAMLEAKQDTQAPAQRDKDWYKQYSNILRYAISLDWKFENGGTLDLIPAGRQSGSYATRVNSFDWLRFYERLGGSQLLSLARGQMRSEYEYILIDSRTGVGDTAGICTLEMPDTLVVCFTLNNQSIEGALAVAGAAQEASKKRSTRSIQILPVPMRLELGEKQKLDARLEFAEKSFDELLGEDIWRLTQKVESERLGRLQIHESQRIFRERTGSLPGMRSPKTSGEAVAKFFTDVSVQYVPYYAYQEILATVADQPDSLNLVLGALENLTSYITEDRITRLRPASEEERRKAREQFEKQPSQGLEIESRLVKRLVRRRRFPRWIQWLVAATALVLIVIAILLPSGPSSQNPFSLIRTFRPQTSTLISAAVNGNNKECFTAAKDAIQIWNCDDGKLLNSVTVEEVRGIVVNPSGLGILAWSWTGQLTEVHTPASIFSKSKLPDPSFAAWVFWPTPDAIVAVSKLGTVSVLQPNGRARLSMAEIVTACSIDGSGTNIVCAHESGFMDMFHIQGEHGTKTQLLTPPIPGVSTVALSPSATRLAVGQNSGVITVYDLGTQRAIRELSIPDQIARTSGATPTSNTPNAHTASPITDITYSPDGKLLAAGNVNSSGAVWNAETGELLTVIQHTAAVYTIRFSHDGTRMITASADGSAQLWSVK